MPSYLSNRRTLGMQRKIKASSTEPVQLIMTCLSPIAKIAVLCSVGACCARAGLLNLEGRKVVSGLVFNCFNPCLFLTKLSEFSFDDVLRLAPLTANMCLTHIVGAFVGLVLLRLSSSPKELQSHAMMATSVGELKTEFHVVDFIIVYDNL